MKTTFRTLLVSSAVFLSQITSCLAQTYVSGFISQNTTWNQAGSPYILSGNALLSYGYTLTIEPGVEVKFDIDKALQINGTLHAIGTPQNHITFTSNQAVQAAGDWAKIHFADTSTDAVFDASGNYMSGCIMKYCDILYGGSLGAGQVHIEDSDPYLTHCSILHGTAAGVYSDQSEYRIDSSTVKNNTGYGLNFNTFMGNTFKRVVVYADTLQNNSEGGIYFGSGSAVDTPVIVTNCYFLNNTGYGGIYLYNNGQRDLFIEDCLFENNYSTAGILTIDGMNPGYIRCNRFISNETNSGVIFNSSHSIHGEITGNFFQGNVNNSFYGFAALNVSNNPYPYMLEVSDNQFVNNDGTMGCVRIKPYMSMGMGNGPYLKITGNEFYSNWGPRVLEIYGHQISTANINLVEIKHNSFDNPNATYELYNDIPYGSPDIYADSNYWGSVNVQHIDSVIYDYFDFANQSVVYYQPVLTAFTPPETNCNHLNVSIAEVTEETIATVYPNPASENVIIRYNKDLIKGQLRLYNSTGKCIYIHDNLSGKEISIERSGLPAGIYFYLIEENGMKVSGGKIVFN